MRVLPLMLLSQAIDPYDGSNTSIESSKLNAFSSDRLVDLCGLGDRAHISFAKSAEPG